MPARGVLYVIWGEAGQRLLPRSLASLRQYHPDLPVHIETLPDDTPPMAGLLEKARMLDFSPFETTLFLDADTVVLGALDFGFAQAERYGLACAICECPWASRYGGLSGDIIEYNTGVIFFTRRTAPLFARWKELSPTLDSSFFHVPPGTRTVGRMPFNDQAGFAKAVEDTGILPAVLPLNWNYRPRWQSTFFGPLKIWHDYNDVPQGIFDANAYYANHADAVMQCARFS
jgi:hypothetical protein